MNVSELAKALGRRGGRARAARLSSADRTRIAAMGARARLHSLQAARRITDNLRYAVVLDELRPRPARVSRVQTFSGPLPGIYATKAREA